MGRLHWREKWSVFGCRRGWIRLTPFVAFVLVGYFGFYALLRASGEIVLQVYIRTNEPTGQLQISGRFKPMAGPPGYMQREIYGRVIGNGRTGVPNNRPIWVKVMWPAVEMEIALYRRGWLPWTIPIITPNIIPPVPISPPLPPPPATPETTEPP